MRRLLKQFKLVAEVCSDSDFGSVHAVEYWDVGYLGGDKAQTVLHSSVERMLIRSGGRGLKTTQRYLISRLHL